MSFLGIENTNEFFTQHYLAAILESDLKPVLERWRSATKEVETAPGASSRVVLRAPPQALGALHQDLFRYLDRVANETDPERRVAQHFDMLTRLLADLGFADVLGHRVAALSSRQVALYGEIKRADGSPLLWLLPVVPQHGEERGTLSSSVTEAQVTLAQRALGVEPAPFTPASAESILEAAFDLDEPPRFVLVLGLDDITLVERAKWAEQRLLRFDLREILGRRQPDTLDITAALLHRESLVPADGIPLLDDLDDHSHKHAFAVSEDLKYALQASIERLGNAAVDYIRDVKKQKVFGTPAENDALAQQLSRECLRYMYRLLFLFYIEARPELDYAPMGADTYRLGYSLERLRELEQLDLSTEEARNGSYIHQSLRLLFKMIYDGCQPASQTGLGTDAGGALATSHVSTFELPPLRAHLFDPALTPTLDGGSYAAASGGGARGVVFSNEVLRDVIENMSLTRPRGGRHRRGRISYATLGINQLGAVYEALLSFRGFIAKTDLFEVKPEKADNHSVLDTAYFVPEEDLPKYSEKERVYDGPALRRYKKGTFVYRLAGRDRQTSASYYTPEVLTRATVKYALKELLGDDGDTSSADEGRAKLSADDILHLTVCEPAMGSAAFLNEAVNQLAEAYLVAKQRELGKRIPHDDYAHQKQRVKMFIADNNVFGVDLNPVAVELAEVSLWLNTIHKGGFVPWFTGQTVCGNSLVGARRQVFPASALEPGPLDKNGRGKNSDWLDTVPERVPLGTSRPAGSVYHFLLGDRAMSVYGRGTEGEPIRQMAKEQLAAIDAWRKDFCAPLADDEVGALGLLSTAIDRLWDKHADLLKRIRFRTTDPIHIWGQPAPDSDRKPTTTAQKDKIWEQEMLSESVRASSPYRRLKLVMDYWCALWFWPIEKADLLPSRDEFLEEARQILDTDVYEAPPPKGQTLDLFGTTAPEEMQQTALEYGLVNVHTIVARSPRVQLVEKLAERYRFLHWELEFADVFRDREGFDLVLGNPPWLRVEWIEGEVLGDFDPLFVLRDLSAVDADAGRARVLNTPERRDSFLTAHEHIESQKSFLGSPVYSPALSFGFRLNLYRCFLPLAWRIFSQRGVAGLLHPEGLFDDPNGGTLRREVYARLRRHYQLQNARALFPVAHRTRFSLNIYGTASRTPHFVTIANLFDPNTIDSCYAHSGLGDAPGIKNDENDWDLRGHRDRIIPVDANVLQLFADAYGEPGESLWEAKLPALHSRGVISTVMKLAAWRRRLEDLGDSHSTPHWGETTAQRAGTIVRQPQFPTTPEHWVISGPHFYVGNPLYKTPRRICTEKNHYDVIDLVAIRAEYYPRTVFVPACELPEYRDRSPAVPWDNSRTTAHYRAIVSRGLSLDGERTLQPAIAPPGPGHVHGVYSYTFKDEADLLDVVAAWSSLVADFFVKTKAAEDFQPSLAKRVPVVPPAGRDARNVRVLLLNCLAHCYSDLWKRMYAAEFQQDGWSRFDPRLPDRTFASLGTDWSEGTPVRSDFGRRQLLLELDVLSAMAFGLTSRELREIYRSQFPVLRHNESDTWYDRNGRIVFTASKGLTGVGLPRTAKKGEPTPAWNDVKDMKLGTVEQTITDDTQPGGPLERTIVYEAPFDRCDREADYDTAWAHFEKRFGKKGDA